MTLAVELTEKEWQEQIRTLAVMLGYRWYHTYRSKRSPAGFPDAVAVHPGRRKVLFIEFKTAKGKLSAAQQAWVDDLHAAGANVHVWRPQDLQEAANILTGKEVTMT